MHSRYRCYERIVEIRLSRSAGRALSKSNKRLLIGTKIELLATDPLARSVNVTRLQGRSDFRLRVQDWRVVFRIEGDILYIDEIEPRGSIYEDRS